MKHLVALALLVACRDPRAPAPVVYTAHRTDEPPRVDGRLDEAVWAHAAPTPAFRTALTGEPARQHTIARLAWDDANLYLAFECDDDDVWSTFTQRDEPLYTQEAVEMFLDPDRDQATYFELELSPRGVLFDAYFPARRQGMDLGWDSGAAGAAQVRGTLDDPAPDQGWSAEIRIPFARLSHAPRLPPRAGDVWRMNLYRLDVQRPHGGAEGQAWSPPLVGDFHHLPRFGYLEFGD